jgi:sec-independent protein translocase protein TatA
MFEGILQPTHLLLILLICMVLFGGKKLPELGKGLGEAIKGFRSAMKDGGDGPGTPGGPGNNLPPSNGGSKPSN